MTSWGHKIFDPGPNTTWPKADLISNSTFESIADDTVTNFLKHADVLAPVRLMKYFSPTDHAANAANAVARMNLFCCQINATCALKQSPHTIRDTPLMYNTGASYGLTPYQADFLEYQTCDIPVKDISKTNRV